MYEDYFEFEIFEEKNGIDYWQDNNDDDDISYDFDD